MYYTKSIQPGKLLEYSTSFNTSRQFNASKAININSSQAKQVKKKIFSKEEKESIRYGQVIQLCGIADQSTSGFLHSKGWSNTNVNFIRTDNMEFNNCTRESLFRILPKGQFYIHDQYQKASKEEKKVLLSRKKRELKHYENIVKQMNGTQVYFGSEIILQHLDTKDYLCGTHDCPQNPPDSFKLKIKPFLNSMTLFKIVPMNLYNIEGDAVQQKQEFFLQHVKTGYFINRVPLDKVSRKFQQDISTQILDYQKNGFLQIKLPQTMQNGQYRCILTTKFKTIWQFNQIFDHDFSEDTEDIFNYDLVQIIHNRNNSIFSKSDKNNNLILKEQDQSIAIPLYDSIFEIAKADSSENSDFIYLRHITSGEVVTVQELNQKSLKKKELLGNQHTFASEYQRSIPSKFRSYDKQNFDIKQINQSIIQSRKEEEEEDDDEQYEFKKYQYVQNPLESQVCITKAFSNVGDQEEIDLNAKDLINESKQSVQQLENYQPEFNLRSQDIQRLYHGQNIDKSEQQFVLQSFKEGPLFEQQQSKMIQSEFLMSKLSQHQNGSKIQQTNGLTSYNSQKIQNISEENSEDEQEQSQNQVSSQLGSNNNQLMKEQSQEMNYTVLNKQNKPRLSLQYSQNDLQAILGGDDGNFEFEFEFVLREFNYQNQKENQQLQIRKIRNNQIVYDKKVLDNKNQEDEDGQQLNSQKGLILKKSPCFVKFIYKDEYECIDVSNSDISSSVQLKQQRSNQIYAISFHKKTLLQRRSSIHLSQTLKFFEQKVPEKINYVIQDSKSSKSTLKFTKSIDKMTKSEQQQLSVFYFENKIGFDKQISSSGFRIVKVQSNLKRILLKAMSTQEQIHKFNCILSKIKDLEQLKESITIKNVKQTIKCIKEMSSLLSDDNDLLEKGLGMYSNNPTQLSIALSQQQSSENSQEELNDSINNEQSATSNYNEQISENIRQVQNILVDTKLMYLVVYLIYSLTYNYNFIQLIHEKDKQLSSYLSQLLQQSYTLLREIIQDNQKAKFVICQYLEIFIKNAFDMEDEEQIQNFLKELFQDNQMIIQDLITPRYIQNIIDSIYEKQQPHPIHCIILSALTQCNNQAVAQNQYCIIKNFFQDHQKQEFHFTFEKDNIIYRQKVFDNKGREQEECQVVKLKITSFLEKSSNKDLENLYKYFITYIELLSNICFGRNKIGIDYIRKIITVNQVLLFLDIQKSQIIITDVIRKIECSMLKLLQNAFLECQEFYDVQKIQKARNWNEISPKKFKNNKNQKYLTEIKVAIDYINNFFTNLNIRSFTNSIFLTQMLEVFKKTIDLGIQQDGKIKEVIEIMIEIFEKISKKQKDQQISDLCQQQKWIIASILKECFDMKLNVNITYVLQQFKNFYESKILDTSPQNQSDQIDRLDKKRHLKEISDQWKEFINIQPTPEVQRVEQTLIQQLIKLQNATVFNILLYLLQRMFSKKKELYESLQKVVLYQKGDALAVSQQIQKNRHLFQLLNEPNFRYSLFNSFQKSTNSELQVKQLISTKLDKKQQDQCIVDKQTNQASNDEKKNIITQEFKDKFKAFISGNERNNSDQVEIKQVESSRGSFASDDQLKLRVNQEAFLNNQSSQQNCFNQNLQFAQSQYCSEQQSQVINKNIKEEQIAYNLSNNQVNSQKLSQNLEQSNYNLESIRQSNISEYEKNIVLTLLTGEDDSQADSALNSQIENSQSVLFFSQMQQPNDNQNRQKQFYGSDLHQVPNPMCSSPIESNQISNQEYFSDNNQKNIVSKFDYSIQQNHPNNFYQRAHPQKTVSIEEKVTYINNEKLNDQSKSEEGNVSFYSENPDAQPDQCSEEQRNSFLQLIEIDQNYFEQLITVINTLSWSMKIKNDIFQSIPQDYKQILEQNFSQTCINFIGEREDHNLLIQNLIRSYDLHQVFLKFLNDTQDERNKESNNLKILLTSIYQFITLMIWNNNEAKIDLYNTKNIAVNHLVLNVGSLEFLKELYNNSKQLLYNQSEIIYISQSILRVAYFTQILFYKAKLIYFLRTLLIQNDKPIKDNQEIVFSEIQKFQELKILDPNNLRQIINKRIDILMKEYSDNLNQSYKTKSLVINSEIMILIAMFSLYSMLIEGPNLILRRKFNKIHPFKVLIKLLQHSQECIPLKKEIRSYLNRVYYNQQYVTVKKSALIHYPLIVRKRTSQKLESTSNLSQESLKQSTFIFKSYSLLKQKFKSKSKFSQDQQKQIENESKKDDSPQNQTNLSLFQRIKQLIFKNQIQQKLNHTFAFLQFAVQEAKQFVQNKLSKFMDKLVEGYKERKENNNDVQSIISDINKIKKQKQITKENKEYLAAVEVFLQPSFKFWSINDILDFFLDKYVKFMEARQNKAVNFQNLEKTSQKKELKESKGQKDFKETVIPCLNTESSYISNKNESGSIDSDEDQLNDDEQNIDCDTEESDDSLDDEYLEISDKEKQKQTQQKIKLKKIEKQKMKDRFKNINEEEDEEAFENNMITRQKRIQKNVKNFIRQNKSLFKNQIQQNNSKCDQNENQSMLKDATAINYIIQDLKNMQKDLEQYLEYKQNPKKYDQISIENYIRFKHLQSYILLNFKEVIYTLFFIFKNQSLINKQLKPALLDSSNNLRTTLHSIYYILSEISERDEYYQIRIQKINKLISDFIPGDNLLNKKTQNLYKSNLSAFKIAQSLNGTKGNNNSPVTHKDDSQLNKRQQFLKNQKEQLTIDDSQQGDTTKKQREFNKYEAKSTIKSGQKQPIDYTDMVENDINNKFNNLYRNILQQLNFSQEFQDFLQKENQRIFDVLQFIPKSHSHSKSNNFDDNSSVVVNEKVQTITQDNLIQSLFDVALSHQDLPDDLHVFYLNILVGMVKRQNQVKKITEDELQDDLEIDQWKTEDWIDNKNEIVEIQKQLRMYGGIRLLCNLLQQQNLEQRLSLVSQTLLFGITLMLGGNQKTQQVLINLLFKDTHNTILVNIAALIQKIGKIAYRFSKEKKNVKQYIDSYNYYDPVSQQVIRKHTCQPDDYQEEQKMELCFLVLKRIFQFLKLCVINNIEMKNYLRCQTFINKRQKLNSINFIKVACDTNQQFSKVLKKETHEVCNYIADFLTEMVKVPCTQNQISLSQTSYFEDISLLPQLINKQKELQKDKIQEDKIPDTDKKEQEEELHLLYTKVLQSILVVLEGDDVQIYEEILSKVPLEFLQIIFNQYVKLIKVQSLSEIRQEKHLEQKQGEILHYQSQQEQQESLQEFQFELINIQKDQLKQALKQRVQNGNYNHEIKNIFQVLIIVKIFSQYDQTISQHFKDLITNEYYYVAEQLDQMILSIVIVDQQKYKNTFFINEPLFSCLSQQTKKIIMKQVNRDTQRDKLIGLIKYSLETIPNEMEYNYYLSQKKIPVTYETIKVIQTVIAYYGIFINILLAFTATVQISKEGGINLYFESDFLLFDLDFLIFIFFLLVILFTIFTAVNQVPPKINMPLQLADKDSSQLNNLVKSYIKMLKFKIQTNRLYLLFKYNEIPYLIMLIVSSFLSLIIHPKFIVLSLPYSVSKLKYVKGVAENLYLAIFMKRRELILISFLGIIFLYIFSVLSFNNYYLEVYSEDTLESESVNQCSTLLQCMITLILSGVVGNNMADWELSTFFSDTLYFIFMSILFTNIITGIMTDTFAELRDQIHFSETDKRNKCYICGIEKLTLENQGEQFDLHIQLHDVWKYSYYIYTINQKNEEQNTGIELQIKKMIQKEDISWLPDYSDENSQ
ncbi:transmembrane protein, putative (macronuclear) [Tetrahymena thermophila SB210]|uniref:Transmembrane protein, putative n=1 Tax=Tetrahymena thermophila (strain SB210) TaxID=312017 RepID=I7MD35_TETTS|nr:transmembrane protein, putative [Tetrahymena thermophila SB210]EAR85423.2 transmembrane protein, putative [Tetrahymena thermophila SB210]|eukprot:XP_001033086.2 transmembrane protein, putative [Tetrahymena thermophila SB210]